MTDTDTITINYKYNNIQQPNQSVLEHQPDWEEIMGAINMHEVFRLRTQCPPKEKELVGDTTTQWPSLASDITCSIPITRYKTKNYQVIDKHTLLQ